MLLFITNSVKQFATTGILQEKIFGQSTSSVSKELNDAVMTEHAMNANLSKQHKLKFPLYDANYYSIMLTKL